MEKLPVVFRAERSGDHKGAVTAVFPTEYAGQFMWGCYAHIGQHSVCSKAWYHDTRAAKPEEYRDLLRELRGIYEQGPDAVELRVMKRAKWA